MQARGICIRATFDSRAPKYLMRVNDMLHAFLNLFYHISHKVKGQVDLSINLNYGFSGSNY